jgi:hypothetical protein
MAGDGAEECEARVQHAEELVRWRIVELEAYERLQPDPNLARPPPEAGSRYPLWYPWVPYLGFWRVPSVYRGHRVL